MNENVDQQNSITSSNSSSSFAIIFNEYTAPLKELKVPENPNETGWDRIRHSWKTYRKGEQSLEFHIINNGFCYGALYGLFFGAMIQNREVFQEFARKHNTNVFYGKQAANRLLADTMYLELAKRSIKHGINYGLFSGSFVTMMTLSMVYRDDVHYTDCALAGALTGAIWRAHLGVRASLVTGTLGSIFGLSFAGLTKLVLKTSGITIKQLRYSYSSKIDDPLLR